MEAELQETYQGGCHCGRIRFRVRADLAFVAECNCSICTKKGFLHLIVPHAQFTLLAGEADLTRYSFNTGVARHMFCRVCGMHPFYVPRSDPDKIDVNARCLDDVDIGSLKPQRFEGRNWEQGFAARPPTEPGDNSA